MPNAPSTLPSGWQNEPTTSTSFAETVNVIRTHYGQVKATQFQAWYTEAWHKDPALTPNQAAAAWLTATALGGGIAATGSILGQVPGAAAKGAENNPLNKIVPQVGNPLDFLSNIADFFGRLTQANTWIRIAEFVLGGALILVGVAHMAKGTSVGQAAAKAVKTAGMAAAL